MKIKRRSFTRDFKLEAVRLSMEDGKACAAVADVVIVLVPDILTRR